MLDDAVLIWREAVRSEFASVAEVVTWVDQQILAIDEPPLWMFDLSLVHDSEEALAVLFRVTYEMANDVWTRVGADDLCVGFLYLRHERGELSMLALLIEAGDEADSSACSVDCETFYALANEFEGLAPVKPSSRPLQERVVELFRPFAENARRQWRRVNGDDDLPTAP